MEANYRVSYDELGKRSAATVTERVYPDGKREVVRVDFDDGTWSP